MASGAITLNGAYLDVWVFNPHASANINSKHWHTSTGGMKEKRYRLTSNGSWGGAWLLYLPLSSCLSLGGLLVLQRFATRGLPLCSLKNGTSPIQWNLRIKDTLGSATLSSVERLSFSQRLKMYYCYGKGVQQSIRFSLSRRVLYQRFHCSTPFLFFQCIQGARSSSSRALKQNLTSGPDGVVSWL